MKREFLQNLKIGDQVLTKEVIDLIMEENGKDIEAAKKPFADYESVKEQLKTAKESLDAFKDIDVNDLKGQIAKLQNDLAAKDAEYQNKIADMEFDGVLDTAIRAAKGKNTKAIRALLDVDVLKKSKNQTEDVKKGIEDLKKENGYLFDSDPITPPYAPGPGAVPPITKNSPEINAFRVAAGLKAE